MRCQLARAQGDQGYDTLLVAPKRDAGAAFSSLEHGKWSDWWRDSFVIDGELAEGSVRCKLIHLSPDGQHVELFFPQIWPITGYTRPDGIAREIYTNVGPFLQNPARDALGLIERGTDEDVDVLRQQLGEERRLLRDGAVDVAVEERPAAQALRERRVGLEDPAVGLTVLDEDEGACARSRTRRSGTPSADR